MINDKFEKLFEKRREPEKIKETEQMVLPIQSLTEEVMIKLAKELKKEYGLVIYV